MSTSVYTGLNPFNFIRKHFFADLLVSECTATFRTHGIFDLLCNNKWSYGHYVSQLRLIL